MKSQNIFIRLFFPIFFLSTGLVGCTTMKQVERAQGKGQKVEFSKDYESVWTATLSALGTLPLDIEKSDKKEGVILASRSVTFFSWGENVGIFVKSLSDNQTSVEVVSKKVVSVNVTARDWSTEIIEKINDQIENSK